MGIWTSGLFDTSEYYKDNWFHCPNWKYLLRLPHLYLSEAILELQPVPFCLSGCPSHVIHTSQSVNISASSDKLFTYLLGLTIGPLLLETPIISIYSTLKVFKFWKQIFFFSFAPKMNFSVSALGIWIGSNQKFRPLIYQIPPNNMIKILNFFDSIQLRCHISTPWNRGRNIKSHKFSHRPRGGCEATL